MNPAESEGFRLNLLQQLRAAVGSTLPVPTLVTGARLGGFDSANADDVLAALTHLQSKRLVQVITPLFLPDNKRWRITALGVAALAEVGV